MINEKYCVFLLIPCCSIFERWTFELFFLFFNVLFFRELRGRPHVQTPWAAGLMLLVWHQMFGTSLRVSPGYSNCLLLKKK